ncbi:unnamed protein product [Cyclocybe aegerita]|uniref:FAD dependent oxidoreductase domain-containing protein n=1 Tax=Cyclocybe aegerita TaxID=1973307 RepID=A0A8S0W9A9_CYCAE|nr:unnamed protein product [Cyclocybe aegerita]
MGAQLSTLFYTVKALVTQYNAFSKRISQSPGIPRLNASVPFWTIPNAPIARHGEDKELPTYADVIIIGSGISGTSIAQALLEHDAKEAGSDSESESCELAPPPLKIVMLEARDACSGATGRNGGHACPNVYNEYSQLKEDHGAKAALEILRFRLAHIDALIKAAKDENVLEASQARVVDDYDAFMHPNMFASAQQELEKFLKEVPKDLAQGFEVIRERKSLDELQLASSILGCIVKPGASIHPYRFVTGILSSLLARHPNFDLYTRTPCSDIRTIDGVYSVKTPRGEIRALHVIHATNAWSSHLLPGMRRKIIPVRAHMSAQRPGQGLMPTASPCDPPNTPLPPRTWVGTRAFVFYPTDKDYAYDYLTQLRPSRPSNPLPSAGELMYGGGAVLGGKSEDALLDNIGVSDDSGTDFVVEAYLAGSLERYFADQWGAEGNEADTEAGSPPPPARGWGKGRLKAVWTGIIGMSADFQPWVGRVPKAVSGRKEPDPSLSLMKELSNDDKKGVDSFAKHHLAPPGEWISAGFTEKGWYTLG